jgi:hypothetical protein
MLYIKIGKKKYPCKIEKFTTQGSNEGIRVISDAPKAKSGFVIVDDDDNVIFDRSDYTNLYYEGDGFKEYTVVAEGTVPVQCYANGTPASPYDQLSRRISAVNQRVNSITPYTETKTAYIDDTEVVFNIPKDGNISVFMVDGEGQNVPHTFEQVNGQIVVSFDKRDSLATVTISIQ